MKKIVLALVLLGLIAVSTVMVLTDSAVEPTNQMKLKEKYPANYKASVDHKKFPILQKKFNSPQEVTAACISCHTERHFEVMKSNHWNWEKPEYVKDRGVVYLGKKNALNNFCIGVEGSEQSCAKCHIGYGMESSQKFDYANELNVDCLVCHDNSETYVKANEKGGAPDPTLNLNQIASQVGKPKRSNCGVCHFLGGGGNNVKHGDLETALFDPAKEVDVHMTSSGANLQCVDCHETEKHNISGKLYTLSSMNKNRSECEQCHTEGPHIDNVLNEHTIKVACQTCHIPTYAKVNATKTDWDWSTAGKLKDGQPFEEDDKDGNHTYLSIKGSFTWGKNLKPDYIFFNGTAQHYILGDTVSDNGEPVVLNTLNGSYSDEDSKIIPVKIHTATQPYDPNTKMIIQPKLYAANKGEGGFWKDFDWNKASELGMKEVNLPYSGKTSFIKTVMYLPVNHMVSTKEMTVQCNECHTRSEDGRLAKLSGFYMPGRDYSSVVEFLGKGIILLTIAGVFVHGSIRVYSSKKKRGNNGK